MAAVRRGGGAYLECRACRGGLQVDGDDFGAMNEFISDHRRCPEEADASGAADAGQ